MRAPQCSPLKTIIPIPAQPGKSALSGSDAFLQEAVQEVMPLNQVGSWQSE